jgi:uncharacterized protein YjiS (DUF1127 family)
MLNLMSNLLQDLAAGMAERRRLRRAYAELCALDDRSLADIGISRSEIPYVLANSAKAQSSTAGAAATGGSFRHAT